MLKHAVYLAEDATDLAVYVQPAARLDAIKADGWEIEEEAAALRAWLRDRIDRHGRPGSVERD
ncbi:hypothetical protein WME75_09965 [Sorangium sp. So ce1014]|uniref:hypothetical protein n=1 Tax=Sorangium sp. So ce1014 TaxID=3133326 RepID=UPI003F5E94D8